MTAAENLQAALESFMKDEPLVPALAHLMDKCCISGSVSFEDAEEAAGREAQELLLLAWDWRLLLPRKSRQCAEWDDRIMAFTPGEIFEMNNIVLFLVKAAAETGGWDLDHAVYSMYEHMGMQEPEKLKTLVREIAQTSSCFSINAAEIKMACGRSGLKDRTDEMIAALKSGGIISPKLMSSGPREKQGFPVYEVHPLLFEAV